MNRSTEPAHPHPVPREEVPARALTLGQPRTCAGTNRPWEQPVLSLRITASMSRAQGCSYNPPVPAGIIPSHVKTAAQRIPRIPQAPPSRGSGGREGVRLVPKKRERVTVQAGPWVQIPTLLLPGCVTSDKSPNLSEFQFLHL